MHQRRPTNHPAAQRSSGNYRPVTNSRTRRFLSPDVLRAIESDPRFAVVTMDGGTWIDPYTNQPVAVPNGVSRTDIAREHLVHDGTWKEREPLSLADLLVTRWQLDLQRLIPGEPRLRIFAKEGTGWLNPWNGQLVTGIIRQDGRLTPTTILQMARHLATCAEARGQMLDQPALIARASSLGVLGAARPGTETVFRSEPGTGAIARPSTHPVPRPVTNTALPRVPATTAVAEVPVTPVAVPVPETVDPMAHDLAKARTVQQHQLSELPTIPGFDLAVHNSAHQGVSGDFYYVIPMGDGTYLAALGDVTGHGVQAALVVSAATTTLRMLKNEVAAADDRLMRLLVRFNEEMKANLVPGQFITMTAALLDPQAGTCTLILAGHHPAVVLNLDGQVVLRKVGRKGMAVGITTSDTFARSLRPDTVALEPGEILLQYTDGLLEAADAREAQFGECGVYGALLARSQDPIQNLVDGIADDVRLWAGGEPGDDLTILAISRNQPGVGDADDAPA